MEAGERWMLTDVAGKPICAWDSRGSSGSARRTTHCAARPRASCKASIGSAGARDPGRHDRVRRGGSPTTSREPARPRRSSVSTRPGIVTNDAYDFKGNLLASRRQLRTDYKRTPDWSGTPGARTGGVHEPHDLRRAQPARHARRRPTAASYRPTYNEANLLERVDVEPARRRGRDAVRHEHRLRRQRPADGDRVRQRRPRPTTTTTR